MTMTPFAFELRRRAGEALSIGPILDKGPLIAEMSAVCADRAGDVESDLGGGVPDDALAVLAADAVARPPGVQLVPPRNLPRRTWGTERGRLVTLHALAHIEANATNLALDAVHRFGALPDSYYAKWVAIAAEELHHFGLLSDRLSAGGASYGDLDAHDGLWEIAVRTAPDVGARLGVVPLVFEARGLDVTPGLIERFAHHGDDASAEVLTVILQDEIGHVQAGYRWFAEVCAERGVEPWSEFERLLAEYSLLVVPPFNLDARCRAGFPAEALQRWLSEFSGGRGRVRSQSG